MYDTLYEFISFKYEQFEGFDFSTHHAVMRDDDEKLKCVLLKKEGFDGGVWI